MTEKRFTAHIEWYNPQRTEGQVVISDNGQPLIETELIEDAKLLHTLLNELAEENEQLKHDATVLICSNQEYRKENNQLKEEIKDLNDILARYEEKVLKE